jgi:hypothetical protein
MLGTAGLSRCRFPCVFRGFGSTTANSSRANEVSGGGRVVIGWQESDVGFRQGAKWIGRHATAAWTWTESAGARCFPMLRTVDITTAFLVRF